MVILHTRTRIYSILLYKSMRLQNLSIYIYICINKKKHLPLRKENNFIPSYLYKITSAPDIT